jgi:hypothetical protein
MDNFSPSLQRAILEVVDNQIRENDPPETQETLTRLMDEGYSETEARRLIGSVVVVEIYNVLKQGKPYNHERYVNSLNNLPELPFDEEV